jgi:hypothetical protein
MSGGCPLTRPSWARRARGARRRLRRRMGVRVVKEERGARSGERGARVEGIVRLVEGIQP